MYGIVNAAGFGAVPHAQQPLILNASSPDRGQHENSIGVAWEGTLKLELSSGLELT
jgi:hypothetical protein